MRQRGSSQMQLPWRMGKGLSEGMESQEGSGQEDEKTDPQSQDEGVKGSTAWHIKGVMKT